MDSIFTLTLSPDVYTLSLILLLGISYRAFFLFFLGYYENHVMKRSSKFMTETHMINDTHLVLPILNPMLIWLVNFIKRKDSPPDDEDQLLYLIK